MNLASKCEPMLKFAPLSVRQLGPIVISARHFKHPWTLELLAIGPTLLGSLIDPATEASEADQADQLGCNEIKLLKVERTNWGINDPEK